MLFVTLSVFRAVCYVECVSCCLLGSVCFVLFVTLSVFRAVC